MTEVAAFLGFSSREEDEEVGSEPRQSFPNDYIARHIPYRITSLELCVAGCHALISGSADSTPLEIDLGSFILKDATLRPFVDTVIDNGLHYNRVLLAFMGIGVQNRSLMAKRDGVTVADFGGTLVPPEDAVRIHPVFGGDTIKGIWERTIHASSKTIAHLTEQGAKIHTEEIAIACYATSLLVRKHFFLG